ncbi:uncharacterized protein LOC124117917 [Haliotis rufescens]|uniref:uncharacterized protein LOC124117917 n=1 Tax=Haliotis rufescens TaxID=6454 RepID=UPI00201FA5B6|nr:uncharacterized protein LOC124117917 [Haliotis rufescens]
MLKLICVVAVVGCSVAEKRCPPKSWRAEEVFLGLYLPKVDNVYQPRKEGDHSLVYYDADNKRSAIISNFTVGSKTGDNKFIFDYTALWGIVNTARVSMGYGRPSPVNIYARFAVK